MPTPEVVQARPPLHNPLHAENRGRPQAEAGGDPTQKLIPNSKPKPKPKPKQKKQKPRPQRLHEVNRGLAGNRCWAKEMDASSSRQQEAPKAKLVSRRVVALLRSMKKFHDIDDLCLWHEVMYQLRKSIVRFGKKKNRKRLDCGFVSRHQSSKARGLLSCSRSRHTIVH